MKKSIVRRGIAMMLSVLLFATVASPVYASNAYIKKDLSSSEVDVYEFTLSDNTTSVITVSKDHDGNVQIDVKEGDKHNTISYLGDKVYVDGYEVVISDATGGVDAAEIIAAPASFIPYYTYSNSPMYLTASAYNNQSGNTIRNNNISLGVPWNSLATGTVSAVLASAMAKGGLKSFAQYASLLIGVAEWAIGQGLKLPYQDAYMSYSYNLHIPSTQPANSLHWEVNCNFYTQTSCAGTAYPKVFYEAYYFSA